MQAGLKETHFGGLAQLMMAPFLERSFGSLHHFCWPGSPLYAEELSCRLLQVALMDLLAMMPYPALPQGLGWTAYPRSGQFPL